MPGDFRMSLKKISRPLGPAILLYRVWLCLFQPERAECQICHAYGDDNYGTCLIADEVRKQSHDRRDDCPSGYAHYHETGNFICLVRTALHRLGIYHGKDAGTEKAYAANDDHYQGGIPGKGQSHDCSHCDKDIYPEVCHISDPGQKEGTCKGTCRPAHEIEAGTETCLID